MSMQDTLSGIVEDVNKLINNPPSVPLRVVFVDTNYLYEKKKKKISDKMFMSEEIINLKDFFDSEVFNKNISALETLNQESREYRIKLYDLIYSFISSEKVKRNIKKILIIGDEVLFDLKFDPVEFAYISLYNSGIISEEIPIYYLTIAIKSDYDDITYFYYRSELSQGREIKMKYQNLASNILSYNSKER